MELPRDENHRTMPSSYTFQVALGNIPNNTTWNKFGYNSDIDIGTETVWAYGGTWSRMTSADTLNLVSSSTADDGSPAGTGANSVIIYGIDENYVAQTEVITLNGTSAVTTINQWLGVNRVAVYLAGSGGVNAGNITISVTTGGSVQGYIPAGDGTTQQAIFFTQDNATALIDFLVVNCEKTAAGTSPKVTVKGWVYSALTNSKYLVYRQLMDTAAENTVQLIPTQPFIVGEKSIGWFEATTDTDNTVVAVRFSLIEIVSS